jgi:hypothetical protein
MLRFRGHSRAGGRILATVGTVAEGVMASGSAGERVVTVSEMLDGHACLDLDCLDRLYLNGYLGPAAGRRAGDPVPVSPRFEVYAAVRLQQIGEAFRRRW